MEKEIKGINIRMFGGITPTDAIRAISSIGNANRKMHHMVKIENPHVPENSILVRIGGMDYQGNLEIKVYKED